RRALSPPFPWRRLITTAGAGLTVAAIVMAAGGLAQLVVIGSDDGAARQRVEADVRSSFAAMTRGLRDIAQFLKDADALTAAAGVRRPGVQGRCPRRRDCERACAESIAGDTGRRQRRLRGPEPADAGVDRAQLRARADEAGHGRLRRADPWR